MNQNISVIWSRIEPRKAIGNVDDKLIELQVYKNDWKNVYSIQVVVAQNKFSSDVHLDNLVTNDYEKEINLQEILIDFPSYFNELIIKSLKTHKLTA